MSLRGAKILVDLGFGDAGKGKMTDFYASLRPGSVVIRFNGGGQAAHNVVRLDGRHHTFAQFGSGTLEPGTLTHLSRFVLVDPTTIFREAKHLRDECSCPDALDRLSVDEQAKVVTFFHKASNRIRELLRADGRHGSCGMGIGETMADSLAFPDQTIYVGDLRSEATLRRKLKHVQERKVAEFASAIQELGDRASTTLLENYAFLADNATFELMLRYCKRFARRVKIVGSSYLRELAESRSLLFEGAQGVLLDEWHGFHPYTTWSTTTTANALQLLREIDYPYPVSRVGILRAYYVRHGPGPFPTEDAWLSNRLPDDFNKTGKWQGDFRVGWFDAVLARYAIDACQGIDELAITNLDRLASVRRHQLCYGYDSGNTASVDSSLVRNVDASGRLVTRLQTKSDLTDLTFQERLGSFLNEASPKYGEYSSEERFLQRIEQLLGVPVKHRSYLPTPHVTLASSSLVLD